MVRVSERRCRVECGPAAGATLTVGGLAVGVRIGHGFVARVAAAVMMLGIQILSRRCCGASLAPGVAKRRVQVVLASGLLLVVAALALNMSRSAPRTAGSDHVSFPVFAATVPGGGRLCQPVPPLPSDAARVTLLIGTYGRPVPALSISFLDAERVAVASGRLAAGMPQGYVTVPLHRHPVGGVMEPAGQVCLRVGGSHQVALGGEAGPVGAGAEIVDGKRQEGHIGLTYLRRGSESWWQLLPTLAQRFGLGKAAFFGSWTLPATALLLIAIWAATLRLLARELR